MSLDSDFHVEAVDDGIVVSLPRSSYSVAYYKPEKISAANRKGYYLQIRSARRHDDV
jgi:hypothetical protein